MLNPEGLALGTLIIYVLIALVGIGTFGAVAAKNGVIPLNSPVVKTTPSITPSRAPLESQKALVSTEVITAYPTKTKVVVNTPIVTKRPLPVLKGGNIFNMVNNFRTANGKPDLSVSDELCRLAEVRADYMMANNMAAFKSSRTGGHTGLIDVSSQYSGTGVGEDLAGNSATDAGVLEIWGNSPPHRDLMLWTEKNGTQMTKGCISTRVSEVGSIVVLLVGDK